MLCSELWFLVAFVCFLKCREYTAGACGQGMLHDIAKGSDTEEVWAWLQCFSLNSICDVWDTVCTSATLILLLLVLGAPLPTTLIGLPAL